MFLNGLSGQEFMFEQPLLEAATPRFPVQEVTGHRSVSTFVNKPF